MIRKILKLIGIAIACVLVTAVISALAYRRHLQHNVAKERQITSVNGIDSLERVRIGGIDQWIQVRGQNASNPILLILHGSPGVAFMPLGKGTAYQDALRQAHERHHERGIAALEALAPYPAATADLGKSGIARGWEAKFFGPPAAAGIVS